MTSIMKDIMRNTTDKIVYTVYYIMKNDQKKKHYEKYVLQMKSRYNKS